MKLKSINILLIALFDNYSFSELSLIGNQSLPIYLKSLNPEQTKLYKESKFIRLIWEDEITYFEVLFSHKGEYIRIEREIWFKYELPWFKKVKLFDSKEF